MRNNTASETGGKPSVEWSWNGNDEMDPVSGRGWAMLDGDEIHGVIVIHHGDESWFVAKRAHKKRRANDR